MEKHGRVPVENTGLECQIFLYGAAFCDVRDCEPCPSALRGAKQSAFISEASRHPEGVRRLKSNLPLFWPGQRAHASNIKLTKIGDRDRFVPRDDGYEKRVTINQQYARLEACLSVLALEAYFSRGPCSLSA